MDYTAIKYQSIVMPRILHICIAVFRLRHLQHIIFDLFVQLFTVLQPDVIEDAV